MFASSKPLFLILLWVVSAAGGQDRAVVVSANPRGLQTALDLHRLYPAMRVVLTTGTELSSDESDLCERHGFPVLRKPFLPDEVVGLARDLGLSSPAASS